MADMFVLCCLTIRGTYAVTEMFVLWCLVIPGEVKDSYLEREAT